MHRKLNHFGNWIIKQLRPHAINLFPFVSPMKCITACTTMHTPHYVCMSTLPDIVFIRTFHASMNGQQNLFENIRRHACVKMLLHMSQSRPRFFDIQALTVASLIIGHRCQDVTTRLAVHRAKSSERLARR